MTSVLFTLGRSATASGLVSAPAEQKRYTIACVHGAPEALQVRG